MNDEVRHGATWTRLIRWLSKNGGMNAIRILWPTFWIVFFVIPEIYAYHTVIPPVQERHVTTGIVKLQRTKGADLLSVNDIQFSCARQAFSRGGCIWKEDRDFIKNSLVTVEWFQSRNFPFMNFNRVISIRSQGVDILTEQRTRDLLARKKEDSPEWMLFSLIFLILTFMFIEWVSAKDLANKKLAKNRS